jgi:hypothetical protein
MVKKKEEPMNRIVKDFVANVGFRSKVSHSMIRRACSGLVTAVIALAVSFSSPTDVGAAKLACKPDVKVKNKESRAIKVLRFGYKADGEDRAEGLDNKKLAPGEEETWKTQKLQHVAEGNPILEIRIEYRRDTSGDGKGISDPWGKATWTEWYPQTGDCTDGRDYQVEVGVPPTSTSSSTGGGTGAIPSSR